MDYGVTASALYISYMHCDQAKKLLAMTSPKGITTLTSHEHQHAKK